jgi:site-specific recombinase XerD
MAQFADLLALHYDANRTRHAYYRQLRLLHQHFTSDPSTITEAQLREYFLFVKLKKHWKPKTIRQALASAKMFFVDLLGKPDWTLFSQIRAKDHDTLPAVLTRQQVQALLAHIRLRRLPHSPQTHLLLRTAFKRMPRPDHSRYPRQGKQTAHPPWQR